MIGTPWHKIHCRNLSDPQVFYFFKETSLYIYKFNASNEVENVIPTIKAALLK